MKTDRCRSIRLLSAASVLVLCAAALPAPAEAVDSFSIEAGLGDRTNILRVAGQWDWNKRWLQFNGTHLGGYWDVSGAVWKERRSLDISGNTNYLFDVGLTPVFRFQRDSKQGLYAEAAVGVHYLSERYNNAGRRTATRFQFGDHVGIGYVFRNNLDIGLRIQHISNGSIKKPNSGIDFAIVRVAYPF